MAEKGSTSSRSSGGVKFEVKPVDGKSNFIETLQCDAVVSDVISYVKLNKASEREAQEERLLTKESSERCRTRERTMSEKNYRSKSRKKNVECYGCNKKRHYKRYCMKLKAEINEGKKSNTSSTVNMVSKDNGELLSVALTSYAFDAWILYSGRSFHMCAVQD
ncbi:hypothetical protein LWI28_002193 [Acer negundo]|uniref:CCHC-type domain-containing protein n=1 Tax=Acer negundo TaxID=4023 RepID=A0AAD5I785_ACENE|nr:hypothetical protein LWI28_002193 [Acer negundo]